MLQWADEGLRYDLVEVLREREGETEDVGVLCLRIPEQLDLSLQLRVHCARPSTKLL